MGAVCLSVCLLCSSNSGEVRCRSNHQFVWLGRREGSPLFHHRAQSHEIIIVIIIGTNERIRQMSRQQVNWLGFASYTSHHVWVRDKSSYRICWPMPAGGNLTCTISSFGRKIYIFLDDFVLFYWSQNCLREEEKS